MTVIAITACYYTCRCFTQCTNRLFPICSVFATAPRCHCIVHAMQIDFSSIIRWRCISIATVSSILVYAFDHRAIYSSLSYGLSDVENAYIAGQMERKTRRHCCLVINISLELVMRVSKFDFANKFLTYLYCTLFLNIYICIYMYSQLRIE